MQLPRGLWLSFWGSDSESGCAVEMPMQTLKNSKFIKMCFICCITCLECIVHSMAFGGFRVVQPSAQDFKHFLSSCILSLHSLSSLFLGSHVLPTPVKHWCQWNPTSCDPFISIHFRTTTHVGTSHPWRLYNNVAWISILGILILWVWFLQAFPSGTENYWCSVSTIKYIYLEKLLNPWNVRFSSWKVG